MEGGRKEGKGWDKTLQNKFMAMAPVETICCSILLSLLKDWSAGGRRSTDCDRFNNFCCHAADENFEYGIMWLLTECNVYSCVSVESYVVAIVIVLADEGPVRRRSSYVITPRPSLNEYKSGSDGAWPCYFFVEEYVYIFSRNSVKPDLITSEWDIDELLLAFIHSFSYLNLWFCGQARPVFTVWNITSLLLLTRC